MGSFAVALQASRVNNNIFRRVLHIVTAGAIFFVWDNMKGFIPNYFARVDFFCLVFVCFCFVSFLSLECLLTFKAYFCLIFIVLAIIDIGYGYSNQSELIHEYYRRKLYCFYIFINLFVSIGKQESSLPN